MDKKIAALAQHPSKDNHDPVLDVEQVESMLNSYATEGTKIEYINPEDFKGAEVYFKLGEQEEFNGLHHALEIPALIRKTVWAEQNGYDAVFQISTFEPGVEESKLAVEIPVIGLFRTALHFAASLSRRIGVLVPLDNHVPLTWRTAQSHDMDKRITDIRSLGLYDNMAELIEQKDKIIENTVDAVDRLVDETNAESIIPLGGLVFPSVVDPAEVAKQVSVPVFNTYAIGVRFLEMCIDFGYTQSPATYPKGNLDSGDLGAYAFN